MEEAAQGVALDGYLHDKKGANDVEETHSFSLEHTDRRGRVWRGEFRCHAFTIRDHASVGIIQSRLANGVSVDLLDSFTRDLLLRMATLMVGLDEAPDWAKGPNIEKIHDVDILNAIYQEVVGHEIRFHGQGLEGSDQGDGSDGSSKS